MKSKEYSLLILLFLLFSGFTYSQCTINTIDYDPNIIFVSSPAGTTFGQTFTATEDADMIGIRIRFRFLTKAATHTLRIVPQTNPPTAIAGSGMALITETFATAEGEQIVSINFGTPVPITNGSVYAFEIVNGDKLNFAADVNDDYPGGSIYSSTNGFSNLSGFDLDFELILLTNLICCPDDPETLELPSGLNTSAVAANVPQDPSIDPTSTGTGEPKGDVASYTYQDAITGPFPNNCAAFWIVNRTFTITRTNGQTEQCVQTINFRCPPVPCEGLTAIDCEDLDYYIVIFDNETNAENFADENEMLVVGGGEFYLDDVDDNEVMYENEDGICPTLNELKAAVCPASVSNDANINDPCACNTNSGPSIFGDDIAADGTFSETVTVNGNALGETWTVTSIMPLNPGGIAPTGIAINDVLTDNNDNTYEITFNHSDLDGYDLTVERASDNLQLMITNVCATPRVVLDPPIPAINLETDPNINLGVNITYGTGVQNGNPVFSLNGTSVFTQLDFDPVVTDESTGIVSTGNYTLYTLYQLDGSGTGMGGTLAAPAIPTGNCTVLVADPFSVIAQAPCPSLVVDQNIGGAGHLYHATVSNCSDYMDATSIQTTTGATYIIGTASCGASSEITLTYDNTNGIAADVLTDGIIFNFSRNIGRCAYTVDGTPVLVPTLGEWGLIILALCLLTIGVVYVTAPKLAVVGRQSIRGKITLQNFNFDKARFFKTWAMVATLVALGFFIAIQVFAYEWTEADPFGSLVASGILAYLMTKMSER